MNNRFPALLAIVGLVVTMLLGAAVARAAEPAPVPVPTAVGEITGLPGADATVCVQFENGQPVKLLVEGIDTAVRAVGCDEKTGKLSFKLRRPQGGSDPATTSAAWEAMLGRPWESSAKEFVRTLNYQLRQLDDQDHARTVGSGRMALRILSGDYAFIGVALVLAVWAGLLVLGAKSGLVRDPGSAPVGQRSFSLARVQMAWWFAIIVGTYIFLWAITGDTPVIGSQALGLMGVSGVTALSAAGVDASKDALPRPSRGLLMDLLSDTEGVTLYRFQMLAMTVILGVMFIAYVGTRLAMPDFDGNTLALLGISAGTYVGFKIPEKRAGDDGPSAPAHAADPKAGYTPQPEVSGR